MLILIFKINFSQNLNNHNDNKGKNPQIKKNIEHKIKIQNIEKQKQTTKSTESKTTPKKIDDKPVKEKVLHNEKNIQLVSPPTNKVNNKVT